VNDETQNPFAAPTLEAQTQIIDKNIYDDTERFQFHGNVIEDDLKHSTVRKKWGLKIFSFPVMFILIAITFNTLAAYLICAGFVIVFGWFAWSTSPSRNAKALAKAYPRFIGPLTGFVSRHRFYFQREGTSSEYLLSSLTHLSVSDECITVAFSSNRLLLTTLHKRLFASEENYLEATQMLESRFAELATVENRLIDNRLSASAPDYAIAAKPADGIPFSGKVTLGDAIASPSYGKLRKQHLRNSILTLIILILVSYVIPWALHSHFLAIMVAVPFSVLLLIGQFNFLKGFFNRESVFFNSRGWIASQGVEFGFSYGRVFYAWSNMEKLEITNTAIGMQLVGAAGLHFFIARSQFSSPEEFDAAVELAKTHCSVGERLLAANDTATA